MTSSCSDGTHKLSRQWQMPCDGMPVSRAASPRSSRTSDSSYAHGWQGIAPNRMHKKAVISLHSYLGWLLSYIPCALFTMKGEAD